jgi:hypothetical protein
MFCGNKALRLSRVALISCGESGHRVKGCHPKMTTWRDRKCFNQILGRITKAAAWTKRRKPQCVKGKHTCLLRTLNIEKGDLTKWEDPSSSQQKWIPNLAHGEGGEQELWPMGKCSHKLRGRRQGQLLQQEARRTHKSPSIFSVIIISQDLQHRIAVSNLRNRSPYKKKLYKSRETAPAESGKSLILSTASG